MKRKLGYVLVIIGLILLVLGIKPVHDLTVESVPLLGGVDPIVLLGVGVVLLIIGAVIMRGTSSGRQVAEVPIYHGKDVVGYRRMEKKRRR